MWWCNNPYVWFHLLSVCSSCFLQRGLGSLPGFWEQHRRPGQYSEGGAQTVHSLQRWVWGQRNGLACRQIQVHGSVSLLYQRTQGPWIQGLAHIQTYIYTYMLTYSTYTYIHTWTFHIYTYPPRTYMLIHIQTYILTQCMHAYIFTCIHTCMFIHIHTCIHTRPHMYVRLYIHTHPHTHRCMQTCSPQRYLDILYIQFLSSHTGIVCAVCRMCLVPNWHHCSQRLWWCLLCLH